jgi:hypothetical protein
MEGTLKGAVQVGFHLTAQEWQHVERELNRCLEEHRITAAQYLAAMTEIKALVKSQGSAETSRCTSDMEPGLSA